MIENPKVGDTVYAVDTAYGNTPLIQMAIIKSVGKGLTITSTAGGMTSSAFGYRTRVPLDDAKIAATAAEALRIFRDQELKAIVAWEANIRKARALIDAAERMLEEVP